MENTQAKKILGVDENGMIMELNLDDNLYIDDNKIYYDPRKETIRTLSVTTLGNVNNMPSIIWPGAAGNGRAVIRLVNTLGNITITGIDMSAFATPLDAHGYTLTLYNVTGDIFIRNEDPASLLQNQFIGQNGNTVSKTI